MIQPKDLLGKDEIIGKLSWELFSKKKVHSSFCLTSAYISTSLELLALCSLTSENTK